MTQIVLHPRNVARFGPYGGARVLLPPPWMWWETRVSDYADGRGLEIRCEPAVEDIRDYFITFGPDRDRVVLTDPPATFLIHITQVQDFDSVLHHRTLLMGSFLTARVVWWTQPGPGWQPVPHVRTCRPGEYVQDSHTRGPGIRRDPERERLERDWNDAFYEPMPNLDWPINPMTVDGQSVGPPSMPLSGDRCRQCQRYMPEQPGRRTITEVRSWGGDLIAVLQGAYGAPLCEECARMRAAVMTPNEIREREGLPPVPDIGPPISIEEYQRGRAGLDLAPPRPMRRPNVLPERDVVDEIDRLVNEQVRYGPVDDYQVNRYPKCVKCKHDWHGLCCDKCTCLGELEDPI